MAMPKTHDKIPAGPVLAALDALGGTAGLAGTGVLEQALVPDIRRGKFYGYLTQEVVLRTEQERQTLRRLEKRIDRARVRGWMSYYEVDEFCCDYLGVHPVSVYGPAWFGFQEPTTARDEAWVDEWCRGEDEQELMAA